MLRGTGVFHTNLWVIMAGCAPTTRAAQTLLFLAMCLGQARPRLCPKRVRGRSAYPVLLLPHNMGGNAPLCITIRHAAAAAADSFVPASLLGWGGLAAGLQAQSCNLATKSAPGAAWGGRSGGAWRPLTHSSQCPTHPCFLSPPTAGGGHARRAGPPCFFSSACFTSLSLSAASCLLSRTTPHQFLRTAHVGNPFCRGTTEVSVCDDNKASQRGDVHTTRAEPSSASILYEHAEIL